MADTGIGAHEQTSFGPSLSTPRRHHLIALHGSRRALLRVVLLGAAALFLGSCSSWTIPRKIQIPDKARIAVPAPPHPRQLAPTPEFQAAHEDITPLKTIRVDLSARNTPLRDVLFTVAQATSLNLVMEKDVNPEVPITLTLTNVTAEDALKTIFTSVDYFYTIRNNLLIVKAAETRTYELGFPAVTQQYQTELGGDVVGAGDFTASGGSGGGSSSGGGGGGGGTSTLKGQVTQKSEGDKKAYDFWDVIDQSLKTILGKDSEQVHVINKLAGTITVTANRKNLERVEQYLDLVRKVIGRQVLVEAKIIEITLNNNLKFGLDWSAIIRTDNAGTITLGSQNFSNIVSGISPTFTMVTTATDFASTLRTIQELGEVRVLSNPRVNIMNGQTSLLCVGQKQSYIAKAEQTITTSGVTGTNSYTVETSSVLSGIIIGIVPYITEAGEISLTVTPILSDLVRLDTRHFGDNQVQIDLPTVDIRELGTTVRVRNGQLLILGGLILNREKLTDNQVPILGDIPSALGMLFKQRDKQLRKTELVILLQPTIVSN
jgi:MSHA type pilus biogenesis protein MshL